MKKFLLFASLCTASQSVFAIQIDSMSLFMGAKDSMVAQHISNPSSSAHLVTIRVEQIDSPYSVTPLSLDQHNVQELTYTPERILEPAGSSNFVKFYYNGPKDEQERYYKIIWLDDPLSEKGDSSSDKSANIHAIAKVGTILVVAPRISHFSYKYKDGILKNTGNISFRMVAYGPCKINNGKQQTCHIDGPVGPGKAFNFHSIKMSDSAAHLGIWQQDQLVPVNLSSHV